METPGMERHVTAYLIHLLGGHVVIGPDEIAEALHLDYEADEDEAGQLVLVNCPPTRHEPPIVTGKDLGKSFDDPPSDQYPTIPQ